MLDREHRVRRFVSAFDSDSDELVSEHELRAFDLAAFQLEFCATSDDPMFDCYAIHREQAEFVSRYLQEPIDWDFDSRSYFVDASAV